MKTMKRFSFFAMMLAASVIMFTFTACGGDGDDKDGGGGASGTSTDSGLIGWYKKQDAGGLENLVSDGQTIGFDSQGNVVIYEPAPWGSDVLEWQVSAWYTETVYYIPDDETIIKYTGHYYKENSPAAGNKVLLFRYNCVGLGYVGVYAESTQYYTYWRDGNKLYTTESGWDIFTITSTGLIPDGGSTIYTKYNPNQSY